MKEDRIKVKVNVSKFWYFHWILTYHKPGLIFSSETVMTTWLFLLKSEELLLGIPN